MATKEFDCIALKRDAAERIYDRVKNLPVEEELAYWEKRESELREWLFAAAGSEDKSIQGAAHNPTP